MRNFAARFLVPLHNHCNVRIRRNNFENEINHKQIKSIKINDTDKHYYQFDNILCILFNVSLL